MELTLGKDGKNKFEILARLNDTTIIDILNRLANFAGFLGEEKLLEENIKVFIGNPEEGMDEMIEIEGL